jgi:hypothetical protein
VVIETGGDEKSPIILGQPLLNTAGAIIYANTAKICFNIKGKRETFFFKDRVLQFPAHPQHPYEPKKKNNRRSKNKNKNKKPQQMELVRMITAIDAKVDLQTQRANTQSDIQGVPVDLTC